MKHHISADELYNLINTNPDITIINVLDQEYFKDCHITGSINIPYDDLLEKVASWDKEKEIIVYCASAQCNKGRMAYLFLQDLGFIYLQEYTGGITEWYQKGLDVTGSCKLPYLHQ